MTPAGVNACAAGWYARSVELTRVATYQRTIRASLERVWENVYDWEHLPALHRSSFAGIERVDSGDWGWRAKIDLPPADAPRRIGLELIVERDHSRYVSRTTDGMGAGSEIWTTLTPRAEHETDIEVEFWLPDVTPEHADGLGAAYTQLYTQLWDEDESMMRRREAQLAARRASPSAAGESADLGTLADVRAKLPVDAELGGRHYRIAEVDGDLVAYSTVCPHWLGPLESCPNEPGRVKCPWHDYEFDLRSGKSADGRRLRLFPAPRVEIDGDRVRLVAR